jgi:beta-glucosidase
MPFTIKRTDFPENFLFGAATAAYQIEGSSFGGAGSSHWDTFAATPGNVVHGHSGAVACDHYHRFNEDLDILKNGGFDAYRFSTNWARVMPEGRGAVNQEGLDFYDRLVDGMLARGIKPYLTLYHWDLPSSLADLGGWRNRDVAQWFADYARVVMAKIGDRVAATATINEPWCVAFLSHFLGHHAPGMRDIRATARAMHHVLLAHGTAVEAMRADGHNNLGIVLNLNYNQAAEKGAEHDAAKTLSDGLFNDWYLGGVFKGAYPKDVLDGLGSYMPERWQDDMATISTPIDWLGINYYTRAVVAHDAKALWPHIKDVGGDLPRTDMGWEIYPEGLYQLLTYVEQTYAGKLPIFITENGMANTDSLTNGKVDDQARIEYIDSHLHSVRRAIDAGVNMGGYFCWSLLDNYEWAFGYDKRFGMVHVDYETQKRTPKESWHALRAVIAKNR